MSMTQAFIMGAISLTVLVAFVSIAATNHLPTSMLGVHHLSVDFE
jgi:hypothetical protein